LLIFLTTDDFVAEEFISFNFSTNLEFATSFFARSWYSFDYLPRTNFTLIYINELLKALRFSFTRHNYKQRRNQRRNSQKMNNTDKYKAGSDGFNTLPQLTPFRARTCTRSGTPAQSSGLQVDRTSFRICFGRLHSFN
jgi:hypothetical protein